MFSLAKMVLAVSAQFASKRVLLRKKQCERDVG